MRNLFSKYVTIITRRVVKAIWLEGNDESRNACPIARISGCIVQGRGRNIPISVRNILNNHSLISELMIADTMTAKRRGFQSWCLLQIIKAMIIPKVITIREILLIYMKKESSIVPSRFWSEWMSVYSRVSSVVKSDISYFWLIRKIFSSGSAISAFLQPHGISRGVVSIVHQYWTTFSMKKVISSTKNSLFLYVPILPFAQ